MGLKWTRMSGSIFIFIDSDKPASNYSQQFDIFKDGRPEEWIKLVMAFREIEYMIPLKEPSEKTNIIKTLFKGQALYYLEHFLRRRLEAKDSGLPDNDLIELVLR
jgi:negative regulator of genetic competence, sporulation and motility